MQVYILSAFPPPSIDPENFGYLWLRESAALDPFQQHRLTEDPAAADLILFVESHYAMDPYLLEVLRHPVYRRFSKKCFLYHDGDYALPLIRGIYPSIRRSDDQPDRCRGAGYIARIATNESIRFDPATVPAKWLYSFIGESNSPVRAEILRQAHPRGLIRDTTGRRLWQIESGPEREAFTRSYAESIRESLFVLCPAGLGPTSYRLFETMEMGRVPVILSDEWVLPPGPAWSEFSVRLPESRVSDLESILSGYVSRQPQMAQLAREEWERWFDKPVCFHRLVETCAELQRTPVRPLSAWRAWGSLAKSPHRRIFPRALVRSWKEGKLF